MSGNTFKTNISGTQLVLNGMSSSYTIKDGKIVYLWTASMSCSQTVFNQWGASAIGYNSPVVTANGNTLTIKSANGKAVLTYKKDGSSLSADFSAEPTSGQAPLTVQFQNKSTGDITSYLWDFGDGQTSTSKNPSHTYQNAGAYTVKLTVTGTGGSDTKARTNYINVKSQPGESKFIEIASDSPGDALNSLPRDVYAGCDLDKDGKKEILVTNYADGGKVHVFEVIGDNKIELVWSSKGTSSTNQYTARSVKIGDLDNNGLQEILVPMARSGNPNNHGLHVFEWDGKSDNGYGDGLPISTFKVAQNWESGSTETIAVGDIDNDGKQEVVYPNNGDGSDDCVFIISCDGKFSQKNIRWKIEAEFKRADGYFGGSPNSSVIGDLDKDGHKEAIIGIWDYAAFLILESTGPDNFVKRAYVKTNPDLDDVCYKTIVIDDFDKDNRDDIIFTLRDSNKIGVVHQISSLENLNNNPFISYIYTNEIGQLYSLAYSDQDNDGEPNIFATQYKNGGILNIQYDGSGDRLSSLNYVAQQLFVDETGNSEGSFAISAPAVDLDGDNLKEVIVTFLEAKGTSAKWLRVFEHNGGKSRVQNWQVITPEDYILNQNYPNPFNSSTEISFKLPTNKNITLEIFDITGKLTKTLIGNRTLSEGYHRISWDGTNNNGENIPSGVYVYRLSYGNFSTSKRLTLVK